MADFTKTISNSLNSFGGITNKWNSYNWGSFIWGEGTADLIVDVIKVISNALTPDSDISQTEVFLLLSNSLSTTDELSDVNLRDPVGYYYVFPSNTTNHKRTAIPSYTSGSNPSSTWTSGAAASGSWS